MLTINYKPSTAHWLFPPIIMGILIFLLIIMAVRRGIKCQKEKRPFISLSGNPLFAGGEDKLKLWGTLILMALYIICMRIIGFLAASIIFLFLYNLLYTGLPCIKGAGRNTAVGRVTQTLYASLIRPLLISMLVSVTASVTIWFLFSYIFKITLP
jgi:hypothetical protein